MKKSVWLIGACFAWILGNQSVAFARPSSAVLAKIRNSYSSYSGLEERVAGSSLAGCELRDVILHAKDAVTREPSKVQTRVYFPIDGRVTLATRTIILLPPTGGENIVDRGYANALCYAGFRVVLVQRWDHDTDSELDLGMHDKGALRALASVRRVLDYVNPMSNQQVGVLGTSIGAITGALALGFDPRLNTGVFVVGGIGMAEIISVSTEAGAAKLRETRMREFGFPSVAEYARALHTRVTIEPGDFAKFSGPKNVLAFVGTKDLTVPTQFQYDLVNAFQAEFEAFDGDHVKTVLRTYGFRRSRIIDFFEKNLPL